MSDLIRRIDAMQACQVWPSDEWSKATKDGYNQAATDCAMAILRVKPAPAVTVQVAKEALMVESIDSVSKTCKLFGLSDPHFRAALRAIAGGGDE